MTKKTEKPLLQIVRNGLKRYLVRAANEDEVEIEEACHLALARLDAAAKRRELQAAEERVEALKVELGVE